MALIFEKGVAGAGLRDELIHEGRLLFDQIRDEYSEFARNKIVTNDAAGNIVSTSFPWMETEAICIALALYARKQAGEGQ